MQKEQFLKKKETFLKEIHTKKEFLDSLQPRLENILKVRINFVFSKIITLANLKFFWLRYLGVVGT